MDTEEKAWGISRDYNITETWSNLFKENYMYQIYIICT